MRLNGQRTLKAQVSGCGGATGVCAGIGSWHVEPSRPKTF
jgi:hypothetical protein